MAHLRQIHSTEQALSCLRPSLSLSQHKTSHTHLGVIPRIVMSERTRELIQQSYNQFLTRTFSSRVWHYSIKLGILVATKEPSVRVKPVKVKWEVLILGNSAAKPYEDGNILEIQET